MSNTKSAAMQRKVRPLAIILLFTAGLVYSLLFPANRIASENGVPALGYVLWISLGGGALMLLACALRGNLPRIERRYLVTYFVGGALSIAAPMTLLALAAPHLPSSVITMIVVLSPLLSYLFALPVKLERFRWLSIAGLLSALSGVLLILLPEASLPGPDMVGWVLLTLLTPVSFAFFNIFIDLYAPPKESGLQLGTGTLLGASLIMLPITAIAGDFYLFPGYSSEGDFAVLCAILINALRWWLMFIIIRMSGAIFVSQTAYIIVLAGFAWEALFFAGVLSSFIWAAAALLLVGLAANTYSKTREQRGMSIST